jgi:4-amino-4-deoxy-L-arabinose transferase-like glycosyltransferase
MQSFPFNADEAIVGLMARHSLQGAIPIFFYGQAYMGSLDALLVAGVFSLTGESILGIRSVQVGLYMLTVASAVLLAGQIFPRRMVVIATGLLLAFPAVHITLYTTVSLGGYGEALLFGTWLMLVAWNLWRKPQAWWMYALWGLLAGLGLWAFALVIVFAVPAGALLLVSLRGFPERDARWRRAGITLAAGVAGLLPWLAWVSTYGAGQAIQELAGSAISGASPSGVIQALGLHLAYLGVLGSTAILGLRPPWSSEMILPGLGVVVVAFWIAAIAFGVSALRRRDSARMARWMLAGVVVMTVLGFLITPFGADPSGRYFLPLVIPMAIIGGEMLEALARRWKPVASWAWLIGVLLFHVLGTLKLASVSPTLLTTQFDSEARVDHQHDEALVDFLENQGEFFGYTTYWVAYPLAFLTDERLIYVPALPYHSDLRFTPRDNRYPPYTAAVASAPRAAYITFDHPNLDDRIRSGLKVLGVEWREAQIGGYHVYYDLSRNVVPAELPLEPIPPGT